MKWNEMIDDFYNPFKKDVENTIEAAERISGEREWVLIQQGKTRIARMDVMDPWFRSAARTTTRSRACQT
jgi:DNA topoisomerase-1